MTQAYGVWINEGDFCNIVCECNSMDEAFNAYCNIRDSHPDQVYHYGTIWK